MPRSVPPMIDPTRPIARPRRNPLPFAAVPHALAEDARLKPIDLAVIRAILKHARGDDHAWPSVASLARQVGRSRRTVQFALRRLESAGWVAAEAAANPTGRVLVLVWRRDGGAIPGASPAPSMAPPPAQTGAPDRDVTVTRPIHREAAARDRASRPRQSRAAAAPDPTPALAPESTPPAAPIEPTPALVPRPEPAPKVEAAPQPRPAAGIPASPPARPRRRWSAAPDLADAAARTADPILARELARVAPASRPAPAPERPAPASTAELLSRIAEQPRYPAEAAELLAREFADRKSWPGFLARCREAWEGRRPPEQLADAYRLATAPGARNPGAIFMAVLARTAS